MEKRICIVGIVIEDMEKATEVNDILHEYSDLFVGRMGVPCKERKMSVITLIADGTNNQINAMNGRLGKISGVKAKVMVTK